MKVSVIITTLNEAGTIGPLLQSLIEQSLSPGEIMVVDAGSSDGTIKAIKAMDNGSMIRIIELKKANRSVARNVGIRAAKNKLIAVTDAGCMADKHWLERLVKPFKAKTVKSVAGFYRPVIASNLQEAIAPFLAVMPDKFNPETYLPSSRSLAFRKGTAWYPETLNYCEDLVFARQLEAAGQMVRVKAALVDWQLPSTLGQFFTRVKNYAAGDVQARYWPHLVKIGTVWLRYALFLAWPLLVLGYLVWVVAVKKASPLIQLTADLAVMVGSVSGIISRA